MPSSRSARLAALLLLVLLLGWAIRAHRKGGTSPLPVASPASAAPAQAAAPGGFPDE